MDDKLSSNNITVGKDKLMVETEQKLYTLGGRQSGMPENECRSFRQRRQVFPFEVHEENPPSGFSFAPSLPTRSCIHDLPRRRLRTIERGRGWYSARGTARLASTL